MGYVLFHRDKLWSTASNHAACQLLVIYKIDYRLCLSSLPLDLDLAAARRSCPRWRYWRLLPNGWHIGSNGNEPSLFFS